MLLIPAMLHLAVAANFEQAFPIDRIGDDNVEHRPAPLARMGGSEHGHVVEMGAVLLLVAPRGDFGERRSGEGFHQFGLRSGAGRPGQAIVLRLDGRDADTVVAQYDGEAMDIVLQHSQHGPGARFDNDAAAITGQVLRPGKLRLG